MKKSTYNHSRKVQCKKKKIIKSNVTKTNMGVYDGGVLHNKLIWSLIPDLPDLTITVTPVFFLVLRFGPVSCHKLT